MRPEQPNTSPHDDKHYSITFKICNTFVIKLMDSPTILDPKVSSNEKFIDGIPANNKITINEHLLMNTP